MKRSGANLPNQSDERGEIDGRRCGNKRVRRDSGERGRWRIGGGIADVAGVAIGENVTASRRHGNRAIIKESSGNINARDKVRAKGTPARRWARVGAVRN